jgi:hypothetical protein
MRRGEGLRARHGLREEGQQHQYYLGDGPGVGAWAALKWALGTLELGNASVQAERRR